MSARSFSQRSETFGFETLVPWSMDAFNLIFKVPRTYQALAQAVEDRSGGVLDALKRLEASGFVARQDPVLLDIRTGKRALRAGRPVDRYVLSRSGRTLCQAAREDDRVLEDLWARLEARNTKKVLLLMEALDCRGPERRVGVSCQMATIASGLPERSGRFWMNKLVEEKLVTRLDTQLSDVREIIPQHWRPTKALAAQLQDVFVEYPQWAHLAGSWRLRRKRFLDDINPGRVGFSGASDYDHDITTQHVLSAVLASNRFVAQGSFDIEPRFVLEANVEPNGSLLFKNGGSEAVVYQPDAVFVERDSFGKIRKSVLEYERYQTRRDGWMHLERMCGWVALKRLPFESVSLRFVVDSKSRLRAYVELIEAFADYLKDHPDRAPQNDVTLYASYVDNVLSQSDPLDDRGWYRIDLPKGDGQHCALHGRAKTPYNDYFATE